MAKFDIIAATGCPTGIAHTFMAKEALEKAAAERGLTIKVETHGQVGVENELTKSEIAGAKAVVVAADKDVQAERFAGKPMVSVGVSKALSVEAAGKLIDRALAAKGDDTVAAAADVEDEVEEKESIGHIIYKHLMNGVSHMLVFVVAGGVLTAVSFLWGITSFDSTAADYNSFAAMLKIIGGIAMNLMVPVLSAYIAESIGKRPALVPGFVAGMIAIQGLPVNAETGMIDAGGAGVGFGFLGGIVGGFLAVSWTDTIQASIMCIALIVTPIAVCMDAGGFSASIEQVRSINPKMLDIMEGQTFVGIVSLLAWGLGYFGQPHILVRFMAAKSIKVIPNARRVGIIWMIFCLAGAIGVGFFGAAYFSLHPGDASLVQENNERVFIVLSSLLFNPWIAGLLMSAILAAVMSTLSCQLLVCSSTLTEDFYHTFIRPNASQRELVWFGRGMVLLISILSIWLASDPESLGFSRVSYAWAGFGAAFGPVILLSLWWRRMTRNGALAGMIVGAATVLIWNHFAWFGLYEILPGFVFASIAIVIASLLDKTPSKAIEARHDAVIDEIRRIEATPGEA